MRRSSLLAMLMAALGLAACTVITPMPAATGPARLQIADAWLRATASGEHGQHGSGGAVNTALYLTLTNTGGQDDRLLRVQADFAEAAELHETRIADEVMTMRPLPDGIAIPAGGQVALEPGGLHGMLLGVREPLRAGETRTVVLQFERSGPVEVIADVRAP